MNTKRRTNQGGSVAAFLIVAALLSAVVIAGAFAIQKRGESVRTNQPVAQQRDTPKQEQKKTTTEQTEADKQKAEEAKKTAEAKQAAEQKAAADKKAAELKQTEAAKQQAAADAEKKRQQAQATQQPAVIPQTSTAQTAKSLPQTGPSDMLPEFIGGAILLGIILAYLKSYRYRFGSLLR